MKTYEYEKLLKSIFDQVKAEILETNKLFINQEGKDANIMCITNNKEYDSYKKIIIPEFNGIPEVTIYKIPYFKLEFKNLIRISGINVLYYIVCMYLKLHGNNGDEVYYSSPQNEIIKSKERIRILKMQNFIFKDEEYKFTFYSLDSIKGTGKFIFDIPPCPTCI